MDKKFSCPLCNSSLPETQYYKIIGAWEDRQKLEKELKGKLDLAEETKKKLILEQEKIKKQLFEEKIILKKQYEQKFEEQKLDILKKAQEEAKKLSKKEIFELELKQKRELAKAQKEFLEKGKDHEKNRTKRLSEMLQGKMEKLEGANKKILESDKIIKELKEQLKKGTTPQIEGLNLEEELVKELKQKFPEDEIIRKGHGGDVYHYVKYNNKRIGFIVYECKKTQVFQKSFVHQIKNDVVNCNATYGVLVTVAAEKDKVGFWVQDDILIVHPYGAVYIAEMLRKWIITLYSLNLNKRELGECARKLLEYIKSDKFKNCVEDSIDRTRQLNDLLSKEVITHKNLWEKRHEHYNQIYQNSRAIEKDSAIILRNEEGFVEKIEVKREPEEKQTAPVKSNYMKETKKVYPRAYASWAGEEENKLMVLFDKGKSIEEISETLERNSGGIRSKLMKMGKIEKDERY